MTALPPVEALAYAARLLAEHGFAEAARNARGDTLYLQRTSCAFALRLSNHARTPKQRQRRTDVLTSLVIREPRSAAQVALSVTAALRDFERACSRRGGAAGS